MTSLPLPDPGPHDHVVGGEASVIDPHVIVGYRPDRPGARETPLELGSGARLRSGTVLYSGTRIGAGLETGHHVVVREDCVLGDEVRIWTNSVIDHGCVLGDRVKIHSNCYLAQYSVLEDDVFCAPGVSFANDLYPGDDRSAALMAGPVVERGASLGVGVTVLPYIRIGAGALIGAGSVVTRDVPAGMVAIGNPARVRGPVSDLIPIDERVPDHPLLTGRHEG